MQNRLFRFLLCSQSVDGDDDDDDCGGVAAAAAAIVAIIMSTFVFL